MLRRPLRPPRQGQNVTPTGGSRISKLMRKLTQGRQWVKQFLTYDEESDVVSWRLAVGGWGLLGCSIVLCEHGVRGALCVRPSAAWPTRACAFAPATQVRWASLVNIDRTMTWWRQILLIVMIACFILYPAWAQVRPGCAACRAVLRVGLCCMGRASTLRLPSGQ